MSENRDTRAVFSVSRCAEEFPLIYRAICFSKVRFSLAFCCRNLVFFSQILAWNSLYTVENPNLLVCRLKFPADRSKFQFCTTARSKLIIIFTRTVK